VKRIPGKAYPNAALLLQSWGGIERQYERRSDRCCARRERDPMRKCEFEAFGREKRPISMRFKTNRLENERGEKLLHSPAKKDGFVRKGLRAGG